MNAIYARQSIDKKDSISIETQIELAGKADPDTPYQVYIDKGFSGKNTKRPQFQQLMNDVRNKKINKVIVYKIDRFSRSLLDFSVAWHELQQYGVDFVSVNEQFDTATPMGKAMLFITEIFAELERETISMRITDNYYSRIKLGRWPGGPAPFGFRNDSIIEGDKKIPTIVPDENAIYVKKVFEDYAAGDSLRQLAGTLNQNGVGSGRWCSSMISTMLKNPVYLKADADIYAYYKGLGVKMNNVVEQFGGNCAGFLVGKTDSSGKRKSYTEMTFTLANWQGYIESDLWLQCQSRLKNNQRIKNTGKGKYTWLSGKIKCGDCKHSIQVFPHYSSKLKDQYRHILGCTGHAAKFCDHIVKIRIPELEKILAEELKKELGKSHNDVVEEETLTFSAEDKIMLAQIDESIDNLICCIEQGAAAPVTITHINRKLEVLEEKRKQIVGNMDRLVSTKKKIKYMPIEFDALSFDEKKIVVEDYIDKIFLYQSGDIEICWHI